MPLLFLICVGVLLLDPSFALRRKNVAAATLRDAAAAHGLLVGTALSDWPAWYMRTDQQFQNIASQQFNLATAENVCKVGFIQGTQGVYDFSGCDESRDFTVNTMNSLWRGHVLIWGNYNPIWMRSLTVSQKRSFLVDYIERVVAHYGSDAWAWDVVNEAITDDSEASDPLRSDGNWGSQGMGEHPFYPDVPDYIDLAFQTARRVGGAGMTLLYNDYNIMCSANGHWMKTKSDRAYNLVKSMKERGIPVDGIGFQAHLSTSFDSQQLWSGTRENFQRYQDLGLEVHITELDIQHDGQWDAAAEAKQARMYRTLLEICLEFPACKTFSLWGFTDKSTWRGSDKRPLIYTVDYQPKAAFYEMMDVLGFSVPTTTVSTTAPPLGSYYRLVGDCESEKQTIGSMLSVDSAAQCWAQCDLNPGCDGVSTNGSDCYLKAGCQGSRPSSNSVGSGWFGYTRRPYNKLSTGSCSSATNHLTGNIAVTSHAECLANCDTTQDCDGASTNGDQCYLKQGCTGDLSEDPWSLNDGSTNGGWSAYTLL